jgi:hypothetical protein
MVENATMDDLLPFIVSVDGIRDSIVITKFIERTTIRDVSTVRERLFSQGYGMGQNIGFFCEKCGTKNSSGLAFNEDFFTAS